MHNKKYYVYMATNKNNTVLYIGVTNDISRRIFEHKSKIDKNSFTCRYNIEKLVYCEEFDSVEAAICAEKKLKGWTRKKKDNLIGSNNPEYKDLMGK